MHALEKVADLLDALADESLLAPTAAAPSAAIPSDEDPVEKFAAYYAESTGQVLSEAQLTAFRESPEMLSVADALARTKAASAPPSLGQATTIPGEASHASADTMTAAERRKMAEEKFGRRMIALGNTKG